MRSVKFYLIEGIKFVKEARDKVTEKIKIINLKIVNFKVHL